LINLINQLRAGLMGSVRACGRTCGIGGVLAVAVWLSLAPAAAADPAPGAPTLVSPTNGETLSANSVQLFTIQASDPDGDPYSGWVSVTNATTGVVVATFRTTPAPSGQNSVGAPNAPLGPGTYTWTATASDVIGNTSPSATPQTFSVSGASNVGTGAFTGSVSYSPALPALTDGTCVATTFSVSASSADGLITSAPALFAGFINFSGSGSSTCENTEHGTGTMTLSAQGLGALGTTLSCPQLGGTYLRLGMHLIANDRGVCTINSITDSISFSFVANLVPSAGAGVTGPIATAGFDGAFTVALAQ
jgi:hypothetical protein